MRDHYSTHFLCQAYDHPLLFPSTLLLGFFGALALHLFENRSNDLVPTCPACNPCQKGGLVEQYRSFQRLNSDNAVAIGPVVRLVTWSSPDCGLSVACMLSIQTNDHRNLVITRPASIKRSFDIILVGIAAKLLLAGTRENNYRR